MRVAFRADASALIGTGHVMRCLTLADGLRAHGAQCVFLSREHTGHLQALVQARGYRTSLLGGVDLSASEPTPGTRGDYSSWLGVGPRRDAEETLAQLRLAPVDWLVVDHYALDATWESCLRTVCDQMLVIDDLANRRHDCEVLLDQNLGQTPAHYDGLLPASCERLIGPGFGLLRPEFARLRAASLARRQLGRYRHILVTMGGVDRDDATSDVLQALHDADLPSDCRITVVMGPSSLWQRRVTELAALMPIRTDVRINVANMAELMHDADLAIGAAGSTSWERCCLGLPTIQLVLADNQRPVAQALHHAGAAHLIERTDLSLGIRHFLQSAQADPAKLARMSRAAAEQTDGQGMDRVLSRLLSRVST